MVANMIDNLSSMDYKFVCAFEVKAIYFNKIHYLPASDLSRAVLYTGKWFASTSCMYTFSNT